MKKTFIYSLVVAAFLVGCGDKDGASITEGVKNVAAGAAEKTKEVAKEAATSTVDAVKEGGNVVGAAKEAVAEAASSAVDAAKDAGNAVVEKASEAAGGAADVVKDAGSAVVEKAADVAHGATAAVAGAATAAVVGDSIAGVSAYTKCKACHGSNAEKKALGTSKIIAGWDAAETVKAMNGYKDGSYGGAMKGVMKGQAASMSDADIANVAAYIATLK